MIYLHYTTLRHFVKYVSLINAVYYVNMKSFVFSGIFREVSTAYFGFVIGGGWLDRQLYQPL